MSGFFNSIIGGSKAIGHKIGYGPILGSSPKAPPVPTAPTIDSAQVLAQQQSDLRARQRGVLANIYAGNNSPAPAVASKTLLGS